MRVSNTHKRPVLWLGFALALPLLYALQLIPHAHAGHPHVDDHDVPVPHSHHSHSHHEHEDDHEVDPPDGPHHHHAPTYHLDTHSLRTHVPRLDIDDANALDIDGLDPADTNSPDRDRTFVSEDPPPEPIPITVVGARGPPRPA
jgi:hypothetical protein